MNKQRMILIDGNNLLFRMFFGMPNKIYDSDGILIHGTVGFIGSLLRMINTYTPDYLIVVFDSEIPSNKYQDINYKKNRIMDYSNVPDEVNPFSQLPDIKKCLNFMGISYLEKEACEADDVIATMCRLFKDTIDEIIIISTDKDYFQLIDNQVYVVCPSGKNSTLYCMETIKERFGILPEEYIFYSAMVGDKSDNIPGIYGIGKAIASKLINEYKNVGNMFENLEKIQPGISKKLDGQFETIMNNMHLIAMDSELNIDIQLRNCVIDISKYQKMKTMQILSEAR